MKYAITSTTGKFGQAAVKNLTQLVPASEIIALARNVEKAKEVLPEGIEVRPGDFTNPEELTKSLAGVERLLFISSVPGGPVSREEQHLNVVKAAKAAGVNYIAYTSFPHADKAKALLAVDHRITEEAIKESGIVYSFLRNNWYLENEYPVLKSATDGKPFVYSAAKGRAGWALEREYAEAAAKVLAADSPKAIYELAGKARTYQDLADAISGEFEVLSVDDETYKKGVLESGADEGSAEFATFIQGWIRDGELDEDTTDLPEVLGHDLVPIAEAIKEVTKG